MYIIVIKGYGINEWSYFQSIEVCNLSRSHSVGLGVSHAAHAVLLSESHGLRTASMWPVRVPVSSRNLNRFINDTAVYIHKYVKDLDL
jgi:hypothetical protein